MNLQDRVEFVIGKLVVNEQNLSNQIATLQQRIKQLEDKYEPKEERSK